MQQDLADEAGTKGILDREQPRRGKECDTLSSREKLLPAQETLSVSH